MEPKIVNRPAFTLTGMKHHGNNANNEIPQLWNRFGPRMGEIPGVINPEVCYGVCDNFDQEKHVFDYIAGIETTPGADVLDGMVRWDIPARTYAVFTCTLTTIGETIQHIYNSWLPGSGYQRAEGPEFELYDENFNPEDSTSQLDLYIPIR